MLTQKDLTKLIASLEKTFIKQVGPGLCKITPKKFAKEFKNRTALCVLAQSKNNFIEGLSAIGAAPLCG